MAEFKKIPESDSGGGPFDAITAELAGQFAATYWPVILGGITLFVLIRTATRLVVDAVILAAFAN